MIKGERIRLRTIEPGDSKSYLEWINDPETNQWRGLKQIYRRAMRTPVSR